MKDRITIQPVHDEPRFNVAGDQLDDVTLEGEACTVHDIVRQVNERSATTTAVPLVNGEIMLTRRLRGTSIVVRPL